MISNVWNAYSISQWLYPNHEYQNMPNLYNFLISIISTRKSEDVKQIIQQIKLHIGMTFLNGFKQYILKKYPLEHELVKMVS